MYNNIGLATPRGSGTSGYVSANKARVRKQKSRLDFIKEMKALRENILPPARKANQDILDHNQKRQIYVKLAELEQELKTSNQELTAEKIKEILKNSEKKMIENLKKGVQMDKLSLTAQNESNSHALAIAKEKQFNKIKNAFQIDEEYEFGSAFDFEAQEKKRLQRLYEKELAKIEKSKQRDAAVKEKKRLNKKMKEKKRKEKKKKKKEKRKKKDRDSASDED